MSGWTRGALLAVIIEDYGCLSMTDYGALSRNKKQKVKSRTETRAKEMNVGGHLSTIYRDIVFAVRVKLLQLKLRICRLKEDNMEQK